MGRNSTQSMPSHTIIYHSQRKALRNYSARTRRALMRKYIEGEGEDDYPLIVDFDGLTWIPAEDKCLTLRIIACAHSGGLSSHRSQAHTAAAVCKYFCNEDDNLEQIAKEFVQKCWFCMKADSRSAIPRVWGHHLQPEKPNEVVTWDFFDVGSTGESDFRYILVIKDRLSGFVMLHTCASEDAFTAGQCLMEWIGLFGPPRILLSDQGRHFTAGIITEVCKDAKIEQLFTTAYCAFSNGCVEAVNKQLKRLLRTLMSENRLAEEHWPHLVPMMQAMVNNRISSRLHDKAPVEIMTALPRSEVLMKVCFRDTLTRVRWEDVPADTALVMRYITGLAEALREAFRCCVSAQESRQLVNNRRREKKAVGLDLSVGDYVFAAMKYDRAGHKLIFIWQGPFLVKEMKNDHVAILLDIIGDDDKPLEMHISRLKIYRHAGAHLLDQWCQQSGYDGEKLIIEEIMEFRIVTSNGVSTLEFLIKWKSIDEPTWETEEAVVDEDPTFVFEAVSEWAGQRRRRRGDREVLKAFLMREFNSHSD